MQLQIAGWQNELEFYQCFQGGINSAGIEFIDENAA
jgi:hypothetical protein